MAGCGAPAKSKKPLNHEATKGTKKSLGSDRAKRASIFLRVFVPSWFKGFFLEHNPTSSNSALGFQESLGGKARPDLSLGAGEIIGRVDLGPRQARAVLDADRPAFLGELEE